MDLRKEGVSLALTALVGAYIVPALPEIPQSGIVGILRNPNVQLLLVGIPLFVVVRGLYESIFPVFSKSDRTEAYVSSSRGLPDIQYYEAKIEYLDVVWEGIFGINRGSSKPFALVEGPFCPRCTTGLDTRTSRRFLVLDRREWVCPGCGYSTTQNHDSDSSPYHSVEKIIKTEAYSKAEDLLSARDPDFDVPDRVASEDRQYTLLDENPHEDLMLEQFS